MCSHRRSPASSSTAPEVPSGTDDAGDVRGNSDAGQCEAGQPALTEPEVLPGLRGVLRQVCRDPLRDQLPAHAATDDLDVDLLPEPNDQSASRWDHRPVVHRSGRSAAHRRTWVTVLLRILAPVPVLAFLGLAIWSTIARSDGWLYGLGVGVI